MNLKPYLKTAWNEPRRFFFFLTLFSWAGIGVILTTNTPYSNSGHWTQAAALLCITLLVLSGFVGLVSFILSWIPPMHRLFSWMLHRRFFVLACLITLVALFYTEENWRGKQAWQKYQREQEAKGERFDLKSLTPPPVPDDQNFAMSPLWVEEIAGIMGPEKAKKWYGTKVDALGHTNFVRPLEMPIELEGRGLNFTNKSAGWPNAEAFDLKLWQDYYHNLAATTNFFPVAKQPQTPAEDVLLALSKYDSTIEELRRASRLPYSQFPLGYTDEDPFGILLPHLSVLRQAATVLQFRAIAELQAGHSDKSLVDIKLIFRLIDAIRTEPIIISHMVRASMLQMTLQPVWEGLAEHHWNDVQLAELVEDLTKLDFLADFEFSIRGERAMGVVGIEYLQRNRYQLQNLGANEANKNKDHVEELMEGLPGRYIPRGWFEQNKLAIAQMYDRYLLPTVNAQAHVISLPAVMNTTAAFHSIKVTPYNWFTKLLLPALENMAKKFTYAQSSTDLAQVAIALERYRLANGTFPESLDVLAPQFLAKIPHDLIEGKPLIYRRTADGQFILYSVGWDGTDDGGEIVLGKGSSPSVDINQGDWVWKYPAK